MSSRWITRSLLGLPLDASDLDALIIDAPELLAGQEIPPPPLLGFLFGFGRSPHEWERDMDRSWHMYLRGYGLDAERVRARWEETIRAARERGARATEGTHFPTAGGGGGAAQCPKEDCPLRHRAQDASATSPDTSAGEESHAYAVDEAQRFRLLAAPGAGSTPAGTFMNMAAHVRGRLEGVRRVIVTDPYVHRDAADDGTPGGHDALETFLLAVGASETHPFTLEITPAPKGGYSGQPLLETPLAIRLGKRFRAMTIKTHKPCRGGFHDRFYIVVDDKARWDGLHGPSINGLGSYAMVLVGDLAEESPAKQALRRLLD